ncbi:MAG TPA: hypothetical protein VM534_11565, partial [Thermoanaerobaculia bacterium]|nr:hypothetical protein [Thermoanaerobaculia bacterium]
MRMLIMIGVIFTVLNPFPSAAAADQEPDRAQLAASIETLEKELVAKHGESVRARLGRGMNQVASLWTPADGDAAAFEAFVRTHFAADEETRLAMFQRLETVFEQLNGLMLDASRQLRMHLDVDKGEILPFDKILAAYAPSAHLSTDLFENKIAFVVLLNFPLTDLDERLEKGEQWTRRQWAEARLAQPFGSRVPAEVSQAIGQASAAADAYISGYNIHMHQLINDREERLFPEGMRLISHWNLRDELKA